MTFSFTLATVSARNIASVTKGSLMCLPLFHFQSDYPPGYVVERFSGEIFERSSLVHYARAGCIKKTYLSCILSSFL